MSDLPLVRSSVADILGFRAQAAQDTATATAEGYAAQGDVAEGTAYRTAGSLAGNNAALEAISGQIQQYQAKRQVTQATGAESADVAGAGFRMSGSNLSMLKSSFQQGYLTDQLIRTQTSINQGGYLEQQAASQGLASAADFAAKGAGAYGAAATTAAATATTNAANETAGLLNVIQSSGTTITQNGITSRVGGIAGTPAGQLVMSTLAGDQTLPASFTAGLGEAGRLNPAGNSTAGGIPLAGTGEAARLSGAQV